jgi:tRNA threonylcarbamoyladenosine biosynthesis protein TsaB
MRILALDTATEACSVALLLEDTLAVRTIETPRGHAEHLLSMVDELLVECRAALTTLDAVAFGRGPGSFTGVRLAASVTQGLAFGAGLPVIPISDLQALAQAARPPRSDRVLVCSDARMREVYWGCFEADAAGLMQPVTAERVSPPEQVELPEPWRSCAALGRGFRAHPSLGARLAGHIRLLDDDALPNAREVALLAAAELRAGRTVSPEEALPVYLRDDVARPNP